MKFAGRNLVALLSVSTRNYTPHKYTIKHEDMNIFTESYSDPGLKSNSEDFIQKMFYFGCFVELVQGFDVSRCLERKQPGAVLGGCPVGHTDS